MKAAKALLLLICILLISTEVSSQIRSKYLRRYRTRELSFCIGATNFIGELGGANRLGSETFSLRDFDFPAVRPTLGGGASYQILNWASLKTNLVVGYMRGRDKWTNYESREKRNIDFRTILVEVSEQFEVYLTKSKQSRTFYNLRSARKGFNFYNFPFTTYLFGGVGLFYFNPQGRDKDGQWQYVLPFHTEGQGLVPTRKSIKQIQICIPLGIGFKYPIGGGYSVGMEYGLRKTFTDYIDDVSMTYFDYKYLKQNYGEEAVSLANPTDLIYLVPGEQRGDPRDKDAYMFALITIYKDISKISRIRNFRF